MPSLNDIPASLKCGICYDLYYKPTKLLPCNHNFCGTCICLSYKSSDSCPLCRQTFTSVTKNVELSQEIEEFSKLNPKLSYLSEALKELSIKKTLPCDVSLSLENEEVIIKVLITNNPSELASHLSKAKVMICLDEVHVAKKFSLLTYACYLGYSECVKVLLEHGLECNLRDFDGYTPVATAARMGHTSCVDVLSKYGADLEIVSDDGSACLTPLMLASREGHLETVLTLHKAGAKINAHCNTGSALIHASSRGHNHIVEYLLQHEADTTLRTDELNGDVTALLVAASNNHMSCIHMLCKYGAGINERSPTGCTALMKAVCEGNAPMVRVLLYCGADVNIRNNAGSTPLCVTASRGDVECMTLLRRYKADLDAPDSEGHTPLMIACMRGEAPCVKLLCELGANLEMEDKAGCTSLFMAVASGQDKCARHLIYHGAKVNTNSSNGSSKCVKSVLRISIRNLSFRTSAMILLSKARSVIPCKSIISTHVYIHISWNL